MLASLFRSISQLFGGARDESELAPEEPQASTSALDQFEAALDEDHARRSAVGPRLSQPPLPVAPPVAPPIAPLRQRPIASVGMFDPRAQHSEPPGEVIDISARLPSAYELYETSEELLYPESNPPVSVSAPMLTMVTQGEDGVPRIMRQSVAPSSIPPGSIPPGSIPPGSIPPPRMRPPTLPPRAMPPSTPPQAQPYAQAPSATRAKSASRVMRPDEPQREETAPEGAGRLLHSGGRGGRELAPPPQPTREFRGSLGLSKVSAAVANLPPEKRLAPQVKHTPLYVEGSEYARFWGAYSAADVQLSFASLLDFDLQPWRVGLSDQPSVTPQTPLTPLEETQKLNKEVWLKLLGGRDGYFGDAIDRQWAYNKQVRRDPSEFAYSASSRFT